MRRINPNLIRLAELTHNPDLKETSILAQKVDDPNTFGVTCYPVYRNCVINDIHATLNFGSQWFHIRCSVNLNNVSEYLFTSSIHETSITPMTLPANYNAAMTDVIVAPPPVKFSIYMP